MFELSPGSDPSGTSHRVQPGTGHETLVSLLEKYINCFNATRLPYHHLSQLLDSRFDSLSPELQRVIQRDGLLAQVQARGQALHGLLLHHFGAHPHVGDIRGRGLFWGLELVAERSTKQWFEPALKLHARIKREAMALGLRGYPMGCTVDGRCGDHVLLAPPFIASEAELTQIVEPLARAINVAMPA